MAIHDPTESLSFSDNFPQLRWLLIDPFVPPRELCSEGVFFLVQWSIA